MVAKDLQWPWMPWLEPPRPVEVWKWNQVLVSDPIHRAQAARWRSGPEQRRVAAILARMMQALQGIRPAWTTSSNTSQNPPVAAPLPVRRVSSPDGMRWWPWSTTTLWKYALVLPKCWRTWCLVLLLMIFPKLLVSICTVILRLGLRTMTTMASRVVSEVGREMQGLVFQASQASNLFEEWLIFTVEGMMQGERSTPVLLTPSPPVPPSSSSTMACGTCPQPCPPWNFLTVALVFIDLALHHRLRGRAG